jgi:hypothetical protein
MDRPPPDPTKLLEAWMEWERGDTPPGRVMSNLKTGGLRDLLEDLAHNAAAASVEGAGSAGGEEAAPSAETWKPLV